MLSPRSLVTLVVCASVLIESISEWLTAVTVTPPRPAEIVSGRVASVAVVPLISACAAPDTLFSDSIAPITLPDAPLRSLASLVALFEVSEVMTARFFAETRTAPSASTLVRVMLAMASTGFSPEKAEDTAGSPISVSTALNSMLVGLQPTVLNAIVKVNESSPVSASIFVVASSTVSFDANTETSPVVAVRLASTACAKAPPCSTLVAMAPPDCVTDASTSTVICDDKSAEMTISPPVAVTTASSIRASTLDCRSFSTTIRPTLLSTPPMMLIAGTAFDARVSRQ